MNNSHHKNWKRANGEGTVTKLSGHRRKPYLAKICHVDRATGEMKTLLLGTFSSRPEAENALYLYSTDKTKPISDMTNTMPTMRELFDKVFDVDSPAPLARSTVVGRRAALKYLDGIADARIGKLNGGILQDYFDEQIRKKRTYYMLENCRAALIRVFDYAIKYDYAEKNYAKYIDISEAVKHHVKAKQPFTLEERNKLWDRHDHYMEKICLFLIYTGIRRFELVNLLKSDIDLDERTIQIKKSKTAAGIRTIPICNRIYPIVKELYDSSKVYFIENRFGQHYSVRGVNKTFTETMKKDGMDHDPHECRHTFATMLDDKDAKLINIKMLMGHKRADVTTGVYTHKTLDQLRETINLLD